MNTLGCACGATLQIDCAHDSGKLVAEWGQEGVRPTACLRSVAASETSPAAAVVDAGHTADTSASLAGMLDQVRAFVQRFVVLTDDQTVAVSLWVFHTHAFDAAETTPYLSITSAEKRSGKTRLLEVLELLVRGPLPTVNISDAAMFRAIEQLNTPTLMFDEIDAIFGAKARDREDLRGMLNAGYRRGAESHRMGGAKMTELQAFPVFCPKVFAGIGELPDTIRDRTIRVRLERRTRDEPIERFRRRDVAQNAGPIRESLAAYVTLHADRLMDARPALPEELDDRAQDVWEPLLAIADLAAGDWPNRARRAAIALSTGVEREDESLGVSLLLDIRNIFTANEAKHYKTADLIDELAKVEESPWGDYGYGKTISAQGIGKLLKPYRIKTMSVWIDGDKHRGYKREQFEDAWLRVLGGRDGRDGRDGSSIEATPTAPTTPTPLNTKAVDPLAVTAGHRLPNGDVRTLLHVHRPDLLNRDDITTTAERREIANLLALRLHTHSPAA